MCVHVQSTCVDWSRVCCGGMGVVEKVGWSFRHRKRKLLALSLTVSHHRILWHPFSCSLSRSVFSYQNARELFSSRQVSPEQRTLSAIRHTQSECAPLRTRSSSSWFFRGAAGAEKIHVCCVLHKAAPHLHATRTPVGKRTSWNVSRARVCLLRLLCCVSDGRLVSVSAAAPVGCWAECVPCAWVCKFIVCACCVACATVFRRPRTRGMSGKRREARGVANHICAKKSLLALLAVLQLRLVGVGMFR